jgi:hypothetical protein
VEMGRPAHGKACEAEGAERCLEGGKVVGFNCICLS